MSRTAFILASRVEKGYRVVRFDTGPCVAFAVAHNAENGRTVIDYGERGQGFYPAGARVYVEDPSGLIGLRESVEVHGPFVTSCTMDRERSGAIHFQDIRVTGPSTVVCNVAIRQGHDTIAVLEHVELNHIADMASDLIAYARSEAPSGPSPGAEPLTPTQKVPQEPEGLRSDSAGRNPARPNPT